MFARYSLQGMGKNVLYDTVKQRFGKKCQAFPVPLDNELRNLIIKK